MSSKPLRRFVTLIFGVLAGVGVLAGLWGWTAERTLNRRLAELQEQGAPITVAELDAQSHPNGKRATELVQALSRELAATDPNWQDLLSSETAGADQPTEEEAARMRAIVESPRARELCRQWAELPGDQPYAALDGQNDFMERLLPIMSDVRNGYRYLSVSARYWRSQGEVDRAMDDIVTGLRGLRRGPPCWVGHLVRVACLRLMLREAADTLSAGRIGDEAWNALDAGLTELDVNRWWKEAIRSERAYGLDQMERQLAFARYWPARPMYQNTVAYYLDTLDSYQSWSPDGPDNATKKPLAKRFSPWNKLVDLLTPAVEASQNAGRTALAEIRCLRVQLRILKQTAAEGEQAEITWDAIDLTEADKTDPFSRQPLTIRRTDEGWIVYSVGRNLLDDGGEFGDQEDVGVRVALPR
ncbi:MAG: hypothetical protein ACUVQQ_01645 [Thermogutta sp.]